VANALGHFAERRSQIIQGKNVVTKSQADLQANKSRVLLRPAFFLRYPGRFNNL
jgi:hypothetical protein